MRLISPAFSLATLWLITGCSQSDRVAVSGSVTLDGKPLETGVINFFPTDGNNGPSAGGPIVNGRYEITGTKGVAPGPNRIVISSSTGTGRMIQGRDGLVEEYVEVVPPMFNQQSTLVRDVQPGNSILDFDLQGQLPSQTRRSR